MICSEPHLMLFLECLHFGCHRHNFLISTLNFEAKFIELKQYTYTYIFREYQVGVSGWTTHPFSRTYTQSSLYVSPVIYRIGQDRTNHTDVYSLILFFFCRLQHSWMRLLYLFSRVVNIGVSRMHSESNYGKWIKWRCLCVVSRSGGSSARFVWPGGAKWELGSFCQFEFDYHQACIVLICIA